MRLASQVFKFPLVFGSRIRAYANVIKSLQTSLLLMTGVAGYLTAHRLIDWKVLAQLIPSMLLAISGLTILNMWWDREIDARMKRTHMRPAAASILPALEVLLLGLTVSAAAIA